MSIQYTISDLVTLDEHAEFRNDVQLIDYDNPARNLGLLRSYLFSNTAPQQGAASVKTIAATGLLRDIAESFNHERLPNRKVVIADYGHGKSHLALAFANYFGGPTNSPEIKLIFDKLTHAIDEPAQAQYFRAFKESKGNFLVIRLRGDLLESLYTQFFASLQKALLEYPATQADTLPFWYDEADRILGALNAEQIQAANHYLNEHRKDVIGLRQEIQAKKDVHALAVGTIFAATNVKPDLLQISLSQAINKVVNTYVGDGKPFGGLFVLFDEFTLYILKHADRNAAGELQDLLNGIEDNAGKAVFLAFAQDDPLNIADTVAMGGAARSNLKKELNRIPEKYRLYSLMESVINAYLKQTDSVWEELLHDRAFSRWVFAATEVAFERFRGRYSRDLHWQFEHFQESVTKGAFPLHPITTALLSNLRFQTGTDLGSPRTVLGFILDLLKAKQDEPLVKLGKPNWVLPVDLVHYFGKRVSEEFFAVYEAACRKLGAAITPEQVAALQALLLHEAANIGARGDDQMAFLAQCAGLETTTTKATLEQLHQQSVVRYSQHIYSFWPSGNDGIVMERLLREKLQKLPYIGPMLERLNRDLVEKIPGLTFGSKDFPVDWGHQTDWAIQEGIITTDVALDEWLRTHVLPTQINGRTESRKARRGYLFWLVARNDAEISMLRQTAANELDRAISGNHPYPVILVLPEQPNAQLAELHQKLCALRMFTAAEQTAAGQEMYNHEVERTEKELAAAVTQLRGSPEYYFTMQRDTRNVVVPLAFRGQVASLPGKADLRQIMAECYRMAYTFSPPAFFTQYKYAQMSLKGPIKTVASLLLHNTTSTLRTSVVGPGVDLVEKYLMTSWGMIGPDQRIQLPTTYRVQSAWDLLDRTFEAGTKEVPIRTAFEKLLNPPYGYDYNTALLVFAAWFGYNGNDLQAYLGNRPSNPESLAKYLDKGPKQFVEKVAGDLNGTIARREHGAHEREVRQLIAKVQREQFTQETAEQVVTKLMNFAIDERNNADVRRDAELAGNDLDSALTAAKEYDQRANKLLNDLQTVQKLQQFVEFYLGLRKFPQPSKVVAAAPKLATLQSTVRDKIAEAVETICARNENLTDLTRAELHKQYLVSDRKVIVNAGLGEFTSRFDQALKNLDVAADNLKKQAQESAIREHIKAMSTEPPLKVLYENCDRLESLSGYSQATMTLRDHRLNLMRQKIEQLEHEARKMQELFDGLDNAKSTKDLLHTVLLNTTHYQGTPFEAELRKLQSRLETLSRFFEETAALGATQYRTTEESARALHSLQELQKKYKTTLSDNQIQLVSNVRHEIEEQVKEQTRKALIWLQQRIQELENGASPLQMRQNLANVPPFFPAEEQPRLQELHRQVQTMIDADQVAKIEEAFRQIADCNRQKECLRRLEQIMAENEHVPAVA